MDLRFRCVRYFPSIVPATLWVDRDAAGAGSGRCPSPPGCRLELVGGLAVLRDVEAELLFLLGHSQADDRADDLEDEEGHHAAEHPGDDDGQELREEEPRVAVEEAVLAGRVDRLGGEQAGGDRKSTRLNSSHANISYAVFCLK